jgi:hypothetical protein
VIKQNLGFFLSLSFEVLVLVDDDALLGHKKVLREIDEIP